MFYDDRIKKIVSNEIRKKIQFYQVIKLTFQVWNRKENCNFFNEIPFIVIVQQSMKHISTS